MGHPNPTPSSLTADLLIDSICDRFEADLRNGRSPDLERYLHDTPTTLRSQLASELQKVRDAQSTASMATETDIGPYHLLRRIGEGGMGEVWLAQQEQPVRRTVALKLIKPGLASRALLARFDLERQALAHLQHPHIAHVLDAGTTTSGRPYFVMEWIEGQRLTAYCETVQPTIHARLGLFLQICHAIQHAHQKGIIHRDLKPANILVMTSDTRPVVKVIDFGVAKMLGDRLIEESIATIKGSVVGTWEYMAPEQAGTTTGDIDTRADVYSLGVILYELLSGLRPFDSHRLRQVPIDHAIRILREEDPPRPSTRLSQATTPEAGRREATLVPSQLRGDLDWIVMKCLEKDRNRRYESVASLARDIERYLASEPIEARPPSFGYQLRKFVKRNRVAVTAGTFMLLALLSGAVAAIWGYVRAEASAAETKQALDEVNFANDTIFDVFTDFDIRRVRQGSDPVEYVLAERLVAAGQRLTPETIRDPVARVRLQNRMGITLLSLDRPRDAIPLFAEALRVQSKQFENDHPDVLETMSNLAEAYRESGQTKEALPLYSQVHTRTRTRYGDDHRRTATAVSNLAAGYLADGQPKEALPRYEQVLAWRITNLGENDQETLLSMNNLAACYSAVGERAKAVPIYEKVLELRTASLGHDHADTLLSRNNLASAYDNVGRLDDAITLLEEAVTLHKAKLGPDHRQTLACMGNLAGAYRRNGRLRDAVSLQEQTLDRQRTRLGRNHPDTLLGMNNMANMYRASQRLDRAIPLFEEALEGQTTTLGENHPDTLLTMNNLAFTYHESNAVKRAIPLYEKALERQRARNGSSHPETLGCIGNLAVAYVDAGEGSRAVPLFAEFVEQKRTKSSANEMSYAATLTQIATYLFSVQQFAAAEPHLREGLAIRVRLAPDKWGTSYTRAMLGHSLYAQKQYPEAEQLLLSGYGELQKRQGSIPRANINSVFVVGSWLAELYASTRQFEKAHSIRESLPREIAPLPRMSFGPSLGH